MKHRGACGGDNDTGDGAGMMTSIPHKFYAKVIKWVLKYQKIKLMVHACILLNFIAHYLIKCT